MAGQKMLNACENCGSPQCEVVMWVDANSGKVTGEYGSSNETDTTWCRRCESHAGIREMTDEKRAEVRKAWVKRGRPSLLG